MSEARVHVYLAQLGLGSRREIEDQIRLGRVKVNGKIAKLGQKVDPQQDQLSYRSRLIPPSKARQNLQLVLLHKPKGVISSLKDPQGRMGVVDLLPRRFSHLYPVGRLDLQSEGLILLTNDGDLALRLTHPRYEVPKVYEVKLRGNLDPKKIEHLEKGVRVGNEKWKGVRILDLKEVTRSGVPKFKLQIEIKEGKNRHIRKLFEALSCRVIELKRLKVGPLSLKGIPRGGYKVLSDSQRQRLRRDLGMEEA
ncbi:MAG: rRNA pseudouridine synthase [Bradymonadales bacterium]|nr:MAG: rRNA pseudouridine synthase [Bradymonadales bacterium]